MFKFLKKFFLNLAVKDTAAIWSYYIKHGVDGNNKDVYIAAVRHPNLGWCYLSHFGFNLERKNAEIFDSPEEAIKAVEKVIGIRKKLHAENNIKWD